MKAIMISIRPEWVAKILNGEKTIEIRKKFPSDYVGWVYIYVTKGKPYIYDLNGYSFAFAFTDKRFIKSNHLHMNNKEVYQYLNGKVVARFWCDKVEEISHTYLVNARSYFIKSCFTATQFSKECCLEQWELDNYLQGEKGKAIHITKLEIFDKPKEISEFKRCTEKTCIYGKCHKYMHCLKSLTRAPQSWCYVEV